MEGEKIYVVSCMGIWCEKWRYCGGREEAERQKQERSEANNALIKAFEALIRENKKYVKIAEMKKKLENVWVGEQMEFEELDEKKYVNRLLRKCEKKRISGLG